MEQNTTNKQIVIFGIAFMAPTLEQIAQYPGVDGDWLIGQRDNSDATCEDFLLVGPTHSDQLVGKYNNRRIDWYKYDHDGKCIRTQSVSISIEEDDMSDEVQAADEEAEIWSNVAFTLFEGDSDEDKSNRLREMREKGLQYEVELTSPDWDYMVLVQSRNLLTEAEALELWNKANEN